MVHMKPISVCGGKYIIKRRNALKFFSGIDAIDDAIKAVTTEMSEIMQSGDIMVLLDRASDMEVFAAIIASIRKSHYELAEIISYFSGISVDDLQNDEDIDFAALSEIIVASIEASGIKDFFDTALPEIVTVWRGMLKGRVGPGASTNP